MRWLLDWCIVRGAPAWFSVRMSVTSATGPDDRMWNGLHRSAALLLLLMIAQSTWTHSRLIDVTAGLESRQAELPAIYETCRPS